MAEATQEIEDLLRRGHVVTAVAGRASRLDERTAHEHWAMRGNEDVAVLIASRTDNTTSLECLNYLVNDDHLYTTSWELLLCIPPLTAEAIGQGRMARE